ncbi:unnamed protein product [Euphydryas editha]|uniref:Uncharacterized protein n=1 Tax=Euphydryas editha TaxID=104508 RepID=A0AAU9US37_EUPED|nr:unnamed protein product [Euphydryas editha]
MQNFKEQKKIKELNKISAQQCTIRTERHQQAHPKRSRRPAAVLALQPEPHQPKEKGHQPLTTSNYKMSRDRTTHRILP